MQENPGVSLEQDKFSQEIVKMENTGKRSFRLIDLIIVLAIIAIVAPYAVPCLTTSRMTANETSAVGALRAIMSAETTYMSRHGICTGLQGLLAEKLIDASLASGRISGYAIGSLSTGSDFAYCFCAAPVDDAKSSQKEYCVTQQGVIYEAELDSSKMTVARPEWTPGEDGVPADFTIDPASGEPWTPISQ